MLSWSYPQTGFFWLFPTISLQQTFKGTNLHVQDVYACVNQAFGVLNYSCINHNRIMNYRKAKSQSKRGVDVSCKIEYDT